MSILKQFSLLAKYNKLMNQRQYEAAAKLSEQDLHEDKGAFFKSVLGTLNHILVGDIIWLKRFANSAACRECLSYIQEIDAPAALDSIVFANLSELRTARLKIDDAIIAWIKGFRYRANEMYILYKYGR